MKAIVAVDKNWAIGKDNALLTHLPGDLKYFKEKTLGKVLVMGRQTLESFPGGEPLPGRTNIVLTTNEDYPAVCEICCSVEQLFQCLEGYDPEDVFIVGGEQVYRRFINNCDKIYVTKIDATFDADRHFPNLDEDYKWVLSSESEPIPERGLTYRFAVYTRRNSGNEDAAGLCERHKRNEAEYTTQIAESKLINKIAEAKLIDKIARAEDAGNSEETL